MHISTQMIKLKKRFHSILVFLCLASCLILPVAPSHLAALCAEETNSSFLHVQPSLPLSMQASVSARAKPNQATQARIIEAYGNLPISFEVNRGQIDAKVKFLSRGRGYDLFLTSTEAVLAFKELPMKEKSDNWKTNPPRSGRQIGCESVVRMKLVGANSKAEVLGLDQLLGQSNYFAGKDPEKWYMNIPSYAKVKYADIYPGVSLLYYGNQQQLEYDFVVAPYANSKLIRLAYSGAHGLRLDKSGDLILTTAKGEIRQRKPHIYQATDEGKREISGSFVIRGRREIGFEIGSYDKSKPLVIDPILSYSTYLGGNLGARINSIAVDFAGNAYLTGDTTSTNFPVTAKAYRTSNSGFDIFVTKLNATGTAVLFSSYLANGSVFDIAVDSANNAYITGYTSSSSFPTTPNAFQTSINGDLDVFVAKIHTNASVCTPQAPNINCREALVYSTFIGGARDDSGNSIALDTFGNAYVGGQTSSNNFPTTAGVFQTALQGGNDAFVTKVNPTGQNVVYSTYLGGGALSSINDGLDSISGIAVNSSGNAYVTGSTNSSTFPTTQGAVQPSCRNCATFNSSFEGQFDAFVTKLLPDATGLDYSTYLGGNLQDGGVDIAIDSTGNAYVAGRANSFDFPTTPEAMQSGNGGVSKSTNSGNRWSATGTGLANSIGDIVTALAIDPTNPLIIYAGVYSFNGASGIFKSTNGGVSWTSINTGLTATNVRALAIAPTSPPTIYAGMDVVGVYKSTDGGGSWFAARTGLDENSIAALAVDPVNPNTIYAGGFNSGVSKSIDGGANWFYTGGPGSSTLSIIFDPLNPSILYAGRTNSVDKSIDGGVTWQYIGEGISNPVTAPIVKALVLDSTAPVKIYAGSSRGVFKTTDGASTPWIASNNGLSNTDVTSMAIDWSNPSIIYAGTANGVFKSINYGNSWKSVNKGLVGIRISSLALHPANPSVVYTGLFGSSNLFVTKINSAGTVLSYSTYLSYGTVGGIALDNNGNAYVAGSTVAGFPTTPDAIQNTSISDDVFLAKLSATGSDLLFSTYFGGSNYEFFNHLAIDSTGNCYLAGQTGSTDFPTTQGAFQSVVPGLNGQGFVAKMALLMTANYDNYSMSANSTLSPPAPGVLGNDVSGGQGSMSAILLNGVSNGILTLNSNGSFTYTPNANFIGYDSFTYKARAVNGVESNIAEVTIQVSGATSSCTSSLSPASNSFPAAGGTGSITINLENGCSWKAVRHVPSFITITSNDTGIGNGMISYAVAANTGTSSRTGIITIAGHTFTVYQGANFNDVPANHLFYAEISKLSARGVTLGCGGGNYCPDQAVTREQMAAFIMRAKGEFIPPSPASQRFNDVPPSNPFYNFIDRLAVLNITLGCSDNPPLYCPSPAVSREQMAAFMIRGLGVFNPPPPAVQRFDDVQPNNIYYGFIEEMAVRGITLGCSANPPLYCPTQSVTRAQMAAFLVRAFDL